MIFTRRTRSRFTTTTIRYDNVSIGDSANEIYLLLSLFLCRKITAIINSKFPVARLFPSQVRNDYLCANHATLDQDVAVQLCCLEIRYFFKDMPQIALDKKSNLEYLEREVEQRGSLRIKKEKKKRKHLYLWDTSLFLACDIRLVSALDKPRVPQINFQVFSSRCTFHYGTSKKRCSHSFYERYKVHFHG